MGAHRSCGQFLELLLRIPNGLFSCITNQFMHYTAERGLDGGSFLRQQKNVPLAHMQQVYNICTGLPFNVIIIAPWHTTP